MKNLQHILLFLSFNLQVLTTFNQDLQDVYQEKVYIREDDLYQIDISKFITLSNRPVVFQSNNPHIQLPGIINKNSSLYLKDKNFSILDFKFDNEYLFILETNQKSFIQLQNDEKDFIIQNTAVNELLMGEEDLRCSDMLRIEKILMLLCYDNKNQNKNDKNYKILFYDYLDNELVNTLDFQSSFFETPKFKLMQNQQDFQFQEEGKINLLVFSGHTQKQLSSDEKFFILEIEYKKQNQKVEFLSFIKEKIFSINNLLYGGVKTSAKILNLIVQNQDESKLVIYMQEQKQKGDQKYVYSCQFENTDDIEHIRFIQCEYKIKKQVQLFFQKQDNFIYQNMQEEIYFCCKTTQNCQMGQIQPNWELEQIIIEQGVGVVVMKIDNEYIIFLNDYQSQTVTWSKEQLNTVSNIFYYEFYKNEKVEKNLILFQQQGFQKKDISFNKYVQISLPNLENLEPVEIYQAQELIMKLEIEPYEADTVLNQYEQHIYPSVNNYQNEYFCKTGWIGENLNYYPQTNQKLLFFNKLNIELNRQDQEEDIYQYYIYNDKFFNFSEKKINVYDCELAQYNDQLQCQYSNSQNINLSQNQLKELVQVGEILFFNNIENNAITYLNLKNMQQGQLKLPESEEIPSFCKFGVEILICVYTEKNNTIQTLKFYDYKKLQLQKLDSIDITFKKYLKSFYKQMLKNGLTELRIQNIILDETDKRKVLLQFNSIYGVNQESNLVSFQLDNNSLTNWVVRTDLQDNPDIKVDSLLFMKSSDITVLSLTPKFKLFGYNADSQYVMSYLSVKNLIDIKYLPQTNLLGLLYESLQDQKLYFALIKITKNAIKQVIKIIKIENSSRKVNLSLLHYNQDSSIILVYQEDLILQSYVYYSKGPILITQDIDFGININSKQYQLQYHEDSLFDISGYRIKQDPVIDIENWKQQQIIDISQFYEFDGNLQTLELSTGISSKNVIIQYPLTQTDSFQKAESQKKELFKINQGYIINKKRKNIEIQDIATQRVQEFNDLFPEDCQYEDIDENYYYCTQQSNIAQILYIYKLRESYVQKIELMMPGKKFNIAISNQHNTFFFSQSQDNDKIIAYKKFSKQKEIEYFTINKNFLQVPELNIANYFLYLDKQTALFTLIVFDAENNNLVISHFDQNYEIQKTLKSFVSLDEIEPLFKQVVCKQPKSNIFSFECVLISDIKIYFIGISKGIKVQVSDFTWELNILYEHYNTVEYPQLKEQSLLVDWNEKNLFLGANYQTDARIIQYDFEKNNDVHYQRILENQFLKDLIVDKKDNENFLQVITTEDNKVNAHSFVIRDYTMIVNQPSQFRNDGIKFKAIFDNNNEYELLIHFDGKLVQSKMTKKHIKSLRIILIVAIALVSLLILISVSVLAWLFWDRKKKNHDFVANESFDGPSFRITRLSVNNQ